MTDIVERLRHTASKGISGWGDLQIQAANEIQVLRAERNNQADEIERLRDQLHLAEVVRAAQVEGLTQGAAGWRERANQLEAELAGLRGALQGVLPWVVTQEVACNGLKCREAVCMSCDSDSEANAQLACDAYAKASDALAARKGEA